MQKLSLGQVIHGFEVRRVTDVPHMNAACWKLIHQKTGATLYYSDRDDGQMIFAVGFRTLPEDDTGVFHILEHSCLDGSEKYPLKEPFVNLLKTSMAVDLNAMTYEERTVYYFISTNEQDYMNLMDVYLDAVFHPLLLSDRRIFDKEAWHVEPDGDGLKYSGVVFNEMQGTENRPEAITFLCAMRQMFPDRYCRFYSGGDPVAIPNLTYEQFVDTYRRFYSNDNAVFYLSGDMDVYAQLACIDGVLSARPSTGYTRPDPVEPQPPVVSPDGVVYYQLGENEPEEGNTRLMLTYALGDGRARRPVLAFSLLARYLTETTESPLSAAVLSAGVGQDFAMDCDLDCLQPIVYFTLNKTAPEHAEAFRRVILDTLSRMVAEGLDHARLEALMANHETELRRASLRVDSGFSIMETVIRAQVMRGDVNFYDELAVIREALVEDPLYFEHLIEAYILNGNHWALTRCIPSRTVSADRRAVMAARLQAVAQELDAHPDGRAALNGRMEAFHAYLSEEDDPAVVASIPHLTPATITTATGKRDMTVDTATVGGHAEVTSLWYEAETNGMASTGLLFDMSCLPAEDLFYARCLREALLNLPAASHTVNELTDRWVALHTNPDVSFLHVMRGAGADEYTYWFHVQLDTPVAHLAEATALWGDYLTAPVFDAAILRRLFSSASGMKQGMISRGHGTALRLAESGLIAGGGYARRLTGLTAYRRFYDLAEHFDERAEDLISGMARVARRLFATRPTVYIIGDASARDVWHKALATLPLQLDPTVGAVEVPTDERVHTALTIPGQVNYCAQAYAMADANATFNPRMRVVVSHINNTYFWDEIRAKGGAYGAAALVTPYGVLGLTSYRDPRLTDTYDVYDRLPDWLETHIPDEDTLGSLKVSTLGSLYFQPQSPLDEGMGALNRYLLGKTVAHRQAEIQDILSATGEDFTAFAAMLRALQEKNVGVRAALGNGDAVTASGLFDHMEEL